jgi:hypothetical protein
MNHPDKYKAKRFDTPGRCREFTDTVYEKRSDNRSELWKNIKETQRKFDPPAPELKAFVGEMHGHTVLSDGRVDIDTYFKNIRDNAKLDFAALTDHDHGGVGTPTLWDGGKDSKWEIIKSKVKEYYNEGKFTTILGYERDSYPFFNNLVLYFSSDDAEMVLDERAGEFTEKRFRQVLSDPNIIVVPHDTYEFSSGGDFIKLDNDLIPPFMEIISRGDSAEYMGNPAFVAPSCCEGGFYQDALKKGAKIGCIGGSDDHSGLNGIVVEKYGYPSMFPGVTGVWAKENTREAIFDALKSKRTYAFMLGNPDGEMSGRMEIDFRINGHWMGESIKRPDERDLQIFFNVKSDVPVKAVTLVKNCRNYIMLTYAKELIFDYDQENDVDSYYLRVELKDGRFGWTSPIWVEKNDKI